MISVIQRVKHAQVTVNKQIIAKIGRGIVALVAIEKSDSSIQVNRFADRILNLRIFPDHVGRMNISLADLGGGLLLVPQFTLAADTTRGTRPSFTPAAQPDLGRQLFNELVDIVKSRHAHSVCGEFGADMQVSLTNDGPVTFILKVSPR